MFNRISSFNKKNSLLTHNIELTVDFYDVSSNYVAVCPKLDIFIHSKNKSETLQTLAKNILKFFDISNVEIVERFKNKIMTKYKMKFVVAR